VLFEKLSLHVEIISFFKKKKDSQKNKNFYLPLFGFFQILDSKVGRENNRKMEALPFTAKAGIARSMHFTSHSAMPSPNECLCVYRLVQHGHSPPT